MTVDKFDLIETSKGELVAINLATSSIRHFEIFDASQLPSTPRVNITRWEDTFRIKVSVHFPVSSTTSNVEFVAPSTLRGPMDIPDVSHIAMFLSGKPAITAVKFRGRWIACWDIP